MLTMLQEFDDVEQMLEKLGPKGIYHDNRGDKCFHLPCGQALLKLSSRLEHDCF